jgi:hypothetical protein
VSKFIAAVVVLGGLVNGGYNLVQAKNDAKASIPDMAWGVTQGVGSWWGGGALAALVHFVWSNRKGPVPVLKPDPAKSAPVVGIPAATIHISDPSGLDIAFSLTGDAEKDVEGRKLIGAVLAHYAAGGAK